MGRQTDQEDLKRMCGTAAATEVEDGMVVGLGTGSTVRYTILELGRRVRDEGLRITGIPTSLATQRLAQEQGIPLTDLDTHPEVDVTIDGADELDPALRLIKGGGGALTREKIVAHASKCMVVVADASKKVLRLGTTFALPVEVIALGATPVRRFLEAQGAQVTIRTGRDGATYTTDNGHPILDARFPDGIPDPENLEQALETFPGVVCCGLFLDLCQKAYVADAAGVHLVTPVPS